jgi:DNA-binding FadR family transcriptional regulator
MRDTQKLHDANAGDEDWDLDRRIHTTIAESCGNQMLTHKIERFNLLVQAIRMTVGARVHVQHETTEQHLELLTAMADGNPSAAADSMCRHLEAAEKSAMIAVTDW